MPNTSFEYLNPLALYRAELGMDKTELAKICSAIDVDHFTNHDESTSTDSWTGDIHGFSNLHAKVEYFSLFTEINKYVWDYVRKLGVNTKEVSLYHTRSWAVRQSCQQAVAKHNHSQSHISLVYYPRVPESGKKFAVHFDDNPNEFCPALFLNNEHRKKGLIDNDAPLGKNGKVLKVETDTLLIFPSKTNHSVPANAGNSKDVRYSISSDIICTLNHGVNNYEHLTPSPTIWSKIN
jgi:hypothetical protein